MDPQCNTEAHQLHTQLAELKQKLQSQQVELDALKHAVQTSSTEPLLWRSSPSLPCGIVRPHVLSQDKVVYVGGGNTGTIEMSRKVYKFSSGAKEWESLPITPYYTFALAFVKGFVTVIGGVNILSSLTSHDLLHYEESSRKWHKTFPAMPSKRCAASATSSDSHAVVIGGISHDGRSYLNTVEVLDMSTMTWMTADPLPKPTTFMCITLCKATDRIYLLGGLTKQGAIRSVFSCTLADLVRSSTTSSTATSANTPTKDTAKEQGVWKELTQVPYYRSGCIAIGGKLIVASGLNDRDQITKTVHVYDPQSQRWDSVGEMAASRSSCSLASLGEHHLMVVGGYLNPRNWMNSLTTDVMECINLRLE